jgi:hypothetical protein
VLFQPLIAAQERFGLAVLGTCVVVIAVPFVLGVALRGRPTVRHTRRVLGSVFLGAIVIIVILWANLWLGFFGAPAEPNLL